MTELLLRSLTEMVGAALDLLQVAGLLAAGVLAGCAYQAIKKK